MAFVGLTEMLAVLGDILVPERHRIIQTIHCG